MIKKSTLILLVCAVIPLLCGCKAIEEALYTKQVVEVPGTILATNTMLTTNTVYIPVTNSITLTNPVTKEVTTTNVVDVMPNIQIKPQITYTYSPPTYVTNLAEKPFATSLISTGGSLPLPFAGLGAILLGWAYSGYRLIRNKKALQAVVTGIEAGRKILLETPEGQQLDAKIKQALVDHQEWAGVKTEVEKVVDHFTTATKSN